MNFLQQYGAFVLGVLVGIAIKLQWIAHMTRGTVQFVFKIDGEKLK